MPLHNPISEKIESLIYNPGLKDTGDLESATHTIVPISRPPIAEAQYSSSLTLLAPTDARIVVRQVACRLSVNIAGLGTATAVNCSVRVDVDDAAHELFNKSWTTTGAKLAVASTRADVKETIFNLLKDGAAHTFYFLFWADVANQATIDVVQLWKAFGSSASENWMVEGNTLVVNHAGLVSYGFTLRVLGTGTPGAAMYPQEMPTEATGHRINTVSGDYARVAPHCLALVKALSIRTSVSVATDLAYITELILILRKEQ